MSAVQDVFDYLAAQTIAGGTTGWQLTRRRLMDKNVPDQQVIVAEDGGPAPEIHAASGIGDSALQDPRVHVTVQAGAWDGDASLAKAHEILHALHGQLNAMIGSTTYLRVRAMTPEPVFAGFDDQGRPRHTVAFMMMAAVTVS